MFGPLALLAGAGTVPAMDKERRQKCWAARDSYWACLDEGNGKDACTKLREQLVEFCPGVWVAHYDRRYDYLKYKQYLETHGYSEVPPATFTK